jgi:hypothetical protein
MPFKFRIARKGFYTGSVIMMFVCKQNKMNEVFASISQLGTVVAEDVGSVSCQKA